MARNPLVEDDTTLTVLEAPPSSESPSAEPLFAEETMTLAVAKVSVYESILKLLTQNCSYVDFSRELLLIIMKVVKSEAGSLLEVNHRNHTLFFRAAVGPSSDRVTGFQIPMGQGIAGYVAESRQPVVISDLSENRMHLKAIEAAVGFETRNVIAVPIIIRGHVYGVLQLLNRVGDQAYGPQDIDLVHQVVEAAGRAIEVRLTVSAALRASRRGTSSGSTAA